MRRVSFGLGSLALGLLAGCGAGDSNGPDCDAIAAALVSRIEVRPAVATMNLGDSLQMQAVAFSCAGQVADLGGVQWRSGDPTVVTVSASGLVKAMSSGTVPISAATQGKNGSASVSARPIPVARVTVEPPSATIGMGRTSTLRARAFDDQGGEIVGRPVTWSSAGPGIVLVDTHGAITGGRVGGPVGVTATIEGKSASSQITVVLVPVNSVAVTPTTSTVGAGVTIPLTATLRDDLGNVLTERPVTWASSDPTTASIASAPGFVTGLKPGTATITATSEGKTGTAQITITVGAPAKLQFGHQPGSSQAGSPITPAVTIEIQDAAGNRVTTATSSVKVGLVAPTAATLSGTLTVAAVNGLALLGNLTVSAAGTYSLTAASTGLPTITSTSFVVTERPAARLAFTAQPTSGVAGESLTTIAVELQDVTGARVNSQTAQITLAIATNPGDGTLGGTLTQTATNGLATFTGLRINRSGTGYTLAAAAPGLIGATSGAFSITAGVARQLAFIVEPCPSGCPIGSALTPAPQVEVRDSLGNAVTGSFTPVTLTLAGAPKSSLTGAATRATDANGVATFSALGVTGPAGTHYTLTATSQGLVSATTNSFSVTAAAATQLAFLTDPGDKAKAGAAITPAVRVEVRDPSGTRVSTSTATVTLALGANPSGATLTGNVATVVDGIASFPNLRVSKSGAGYTLVATSPTLTPATGPTFRIR